MASNSKLKLKLLIDNESQKVLFAEVGKDVVDFLFSLLAMPIGSIVKLITKEAMAGCPGTITMSYGTPCPACREMMVVKLEFVTGSNVKKEEDKGEKGVVTYTIMDDLSVMPMSTISSSVTLLNQFGIKDLSTLQEETVDLSLPEGLELLKASLQSKNVLTDVFLTKKKKERLNKTFSSF